MWTAYPWAVSCLLAEVPRNYLSCTYLWGEERNAFPELRGTSDILVTVQIWAKGLDSRHVGLSLLSRAVLALDARTSVLCCCLLASRPSQGFERKYLRAAPRAVEHSVGQEPHLGVRALLAGVSTQGIRHGGYLTKGLQHRSAHRAGAQVTLGRVLSRRLQFTNLAKGTDQRA